MIDKQELPKITQVKIFGERHTATNAITAFIHQNFNAQCRYYDLLGWKHRRAPERAEWSKVNYLETLFIFSVRDPYDWLEAMHREPYYYHQPQITELNFEQFIAHPIEDYENVVKMWNEKYIGYLKMLRETPNAMLIRMEDFIENQQSVFNDLQSYLQNKQDFQAMTRYVSGKGWEDKKMEFKVTAPNSRKISAINCDIDHQLVNMLGYRLRGGVTN